MDTLLRQLRSSLSACESATGASPPASTLRCCVTAISLMQQLMTASGSTPHHEAVRCLLDALLMPRPVVASAAAATLQALATCSQHQPVFVQMCLPLLWQVITRQRTGPFQLAIVVIDASMAHLDRQSRHAACKHLLHEIRNSPPAGGSREDGASLCVNLTRMTRDASTVRQALVAWALLVRFLDARLQDTRSINALLKCIEPAFKHADTHVRYEAVSVWRHLVDSFSAASGGCLHTNAKRLRLLVLPLATPCTRSEQLLRVKLQVWWRVVTALHSHAAHAFDVVVAPLLVACFGVVQEDCERTAAAGNTTEQHFHTALAWPGVVPLVVDILQRLVSSSVDVESGDRRKTDAAADEDGLEGFLPASVVQPDTLSDARTAQWVHALVSCAAIVSDVPHLTRPALLRRVVAPFCGRVLECLSDVKTDESECPGRRKQLEATICAVVHALPTDFLSYSFSDNNNEDKAAAMLKIANSPALSLLQLLCRQSAWQLWLPRGDNDDGDKRGVFVRLVQALPAPFLPQLSRVAAACGLGSGFKDNARFLPAIWSQLAELLTEHVNQTGDVDCGSMVQHDFSAALDILCLPMNVLLNNDVISVDNYATCWQQCELRWTELCTLLNSKAELVATAPLNAFPDELAVRLMNLLVQQLTAVTWSAEEAQCVSDSGRDRLCSTASVCAFGLHRILLSCKLKSTTAQMAGSRDVTPSSARKTRSKSFSVTETGQTPPSRLPVTSVADDSSQNTQQLGVPNVWRLLEQLAGAFQLVAQHNAASQQHLHVLIDRLHACLTACLCDRVPAAVAAAPTSAVLPAVIGVLRVLLEWRLAEHVQQPTAALTLVDKCYVSTVTYVTRCFSGTTHRTTDNEGSCDHVWRVVAPLVVACPNTAATSRLTCIELLANCQAPSRACSDTPAVHTAVTAVQLRQKSQTAERQTHEHEQSPSAMSVSKSASDERVVARGAGSPTTAVSPWKSAALPDGSGDTQTEFFVPPNSGAVCATRRSGSVSRRPSGPLTEHQRERMSVRRDDIPALYADLSQDTQPSQSLSSQALSSQAVPANASFTPADNAALTFAGAVDGGAAARKPPTTAENVDKSSVVRPIASARTHVQLASTDDVTPRTGEHTKQTLMTPADVSADSGSIAVTDDNARLAWSASAAVVRDNSVTRGRRASTGAARKTSNTMKKKRRVLALVGGQYQTPPDNCVLPAPVQTQLGPSPGCEQHALSTSSLPANEHSVELSLSCTQPPTHSDKQQTLSFNHRAADAEKQSVSFSQPDEGIREARGVLVEQNRASTERDVGQKHHSSGSSCRRHLQFSVASTEPQQQAVFPAELSDTTGVAADIADSAVSGRRKRGRGAKRKTAARTRRSVPASHIGSDLDASTSVVSCTADTSATGKKTAVGRRAKSLAAPLASDASPFSLSCQHVQSTAEDQSDGRSDNLPNSLHESRVLSEHTYASPSSSGRDAHLNCTPDMSPDEKRARTADQSPKVNITHAACDTVHENTSTSALNDAAGPLQLESVTVNGCPSNAGSLCGEISGVSTTHSATVSDDDVAQTDVLSNQQAHRDGGNCSLWTCHSPRATEDPAASSASIAASDGMNAEDAVCSPVGHVYKGQRLLIRRLCSNELLSPRVNAFFQRSQRRRSLAAVRTSTAAAAASCSRDRRKSVPVKLPYDLEQPAQPSVSNRGRRGRRHSTRRGSAELNTVDKDVSSVAKARTPRSRSRRSVAQMSAAAMAEESFDSQVPQTSVQKQNSGQASDAATSSDVLERHGNDDSSHGSNAACPAAIQSQLITSPPTAKSCHLTSVSNVKQVEPTLSQSKSDADIESGGRQVDPVSPSSGSLDVSIEKPLMVISDEAASSATVQSTVRDQFRAEKLCSHDSSVLESDVCDSFTPAVQTTQPIPDDRRSVSARRSRRRRRSVAMAAQYRRVQGKFRRSSAPNIAPVSPPVGPAIVESVESPLNVVEPLSVVADTVLKSPHGVAPKMASQEPQVQGDEHSVADNQSVDRVETTTDALTSPESGEVESMTVDVSVPVSSSCPLDEAASESVDKSVSLGDGSSSTHLHSGKIVQQSVRVEQSDESAVLNSGNTGSIVDPVQDELSKSFDRSESQGACNQLPSASAAEVKEDTTVSADQCSPYHRDSTVSQPGLGRHCDVTTTGAESKMTCLDRSRTAGVESVADRLAEANEQVAALCAAKQTPLRSPALPLSTGRPSVTMASCSRAERLIDLARRRNGLSSEACVVLTDVSKPGCPSSAGVDPVGASTDPAAAAATCSESGSTQSSPVQVRPAWLRHVYSPSASPSAGILKKRRKRCVSGDSDISPVSSKRRVVQFSEPPVSESVEIPAATSTRRRLVGSATGAGKVISRRRRQLASLMALHRTDASDLPAKPLVAPSSDSPPDDEGEELANDAGPSTRPQWTEVCGELVDCEEDIGVVVPALTSTACQPGLCRLLAGRRLFTVGQLARCTPQQLATLPVRPPQVLTVQAALRQFAARRRVTRRSGESLTDAAIDGGQVAAAAASSKSSSPEADTDLCVEACQHDQLSVDIMQHVNAACNNQAEHSQTSMTLSDADALNHDTAKLSESVSEQSPGVLVWPANNDNDDDSSPFTGRSSPQPTDVSVPQEEANSPPLSCGSHSNGSLTGTSLLDARSSLFTSSVDGARKSDPAGTMSVAVQTDPPTAQQLSQMLLSAGSDQVHLLVQWCLQALAGVSSANSSPE